MIQTQIFSILSNDADVLEIAGRRIYPLAIPQRGSIPAVVYQVITSVPVTSLDGDSGLDGVRIQIKSWAKSYAGAQTLAAAVRNALTGSPTIKILSEFHADDQDLETHSFCVISQYSVWSEVDLEGEPGETPTFISPVREMVPYPFEGDDVATEFTFPHTFRAGSLILFKNGVLAKKGAGETYEELPDRSGVVFPTPPAGGEYKDEFFAYFAKE